MEGKGNSCRAGGTAKGIQGHNKPGAEKAALCFMSMFGESWSNGSFFRQAMLMWFYCSVCIGAVITNFMTALRQMSVRTHSLPTLHLRLLPSFLTPPSHCHHSPLQIGLLFVATRPFFPDHCHPFFLIIFQAEKANTFYKQLYCPFQSLLFTGSLKTRACNFQWVSSMHWVLIFVTVFIAVLWLLWFLLNTFFVMKFYTMSYKVTHFFTLSFACDLWSFSSACC